MSKSLHDLAKEGNVKEIKKLLAKPKGAPNPNHDDGTGTALHAAAANGQLLACAALVEGGADVDKKNGSGWTPLHSAAFYGHTATALGLLELGALPNEKNADEKTPVELARDWGHQGIADAIDEAVTGRKKASRSVVRY